MFKKTYKAKSMTFHEMHSLWLVLSTIPGNTTKEIAAYVVAIPSVFDRVCKVLYANKVDNSNPMKEFLLSMSLDKVKYLDFKEVMNGS